MDAMRCTPGCVPKNKRTQTSKYKNEMPSLGGKLRSHSVKPRKLSPTLHSSETLSGLPGWSSACHSVRETNREARGHILLLVIALTSRIRVLIVLFVRVGRSCALSVWCEYSVGLCHSTVDGKCPVGSAEPRRSTLPKRVRAQTRQGRNPALTRCHAPFFPGHCWSRRICIDCVDSVHC